MKFTVSTPDQIDRIFVRSVDGSGGIVLTLDEYQAAKDSCATFIGMLHGKVHYPADDIEEFLDEYQVDAFEFDFRDYGEPPLRILLAGAPDHMTAIRFWLTFP